MKEVKTGRDHYKGLGLKVTEVALKERTKEYYERTAVRKGWSLIQLLSFVLEKNVPKRKAG